VSSGSPPSSQQQQEQQRPTGEESPEPGDPTHGGYQRLQEAAGEPAAGQETGEQQSPVEPVVVVISNDTGDAASRHNDDLV